MNTERKQFALGLYATERELKKIYKDPAKYAHHEDRRLLSLLREQAAFQDPLINQIKVRSGVLFVHLTTGGTFTVPQ